VAAPVPLHPASGPPPPLPKRNRQRTASPLGAGETQPENSETLADAASPPDESSESAAALKSPPEETHEDFTTPVEELPNHPLMRSISPSSIPLPLSAPATPIQAVFASPQHSQAPSRVSTPSNALPNEESKPSNPAPPPLPRRAATRVRPSSLTVAAPVTAPAAVPETENDEKENDESSAKVTEPAAVPAIAADAAPSTEKSDDSAAAAMQTDEEDIHSAVAPVPEAGHEQREHGGSPAPQAQPGPERNELPMQEPQSDESQRNGPVSGTGPVDVSDASPDEKVSEEDAAMFVGTSTWEERTWRELMKLREEMFWARVGGVR